jgi:sigma-B regulation protein RsbU (phosphoserine phosphatase)
MKKQLRTLIVEDSEFDAMMLVNLLRKGGYKPEHLRVETASAMQDALRDQEWDLILADYNLPEFSAPEALKLLQWTGIDVPFIIISGGIGEDIAVEAMKAGAHDYLMKGSLARLAPCVERELREAEERRGRRRAEEAMRESEQRYRALWETATDAVLLMDANSVIQFANPAVEQVFGYTPHEIIGQNLTLLLPERVREEQRNSFEEHLISGVLDRNRRILETVGVRKEKDEVMIEIAYNDMELKGERHFVAFIRDITERKLAEKKLRDNQEQFRVASEIQRSLFPKASPELSGFDIGGVSYPAEAAGGDYFDYLEMPDTKWGFVVGDVSGHGVGPALLMAETRAYLRLLARTNREVEGILTQANRMISEDVDGERYVTAVFVSLDPERRVIECASAGHTPGFVISRKGAIKAKLTRTGVPLGMRFDSPYGKGESVTLESGDIVLLATDGIDEAVNAENEFYGLDAAVRVVHENRDAPAAEIVERLYESVKAFADGAPIEDDVTAMVIKAL